jgi:hypothetical protein
MGEEDEDRPWEKPGAVRKDCEPHRGPFLLLCSYFCLAAGALTVPSFVTGVIALPAGLLVWAVSRYDLRRMEAGRLDPAGSAPTRSAGDRALAAVFVSVLGLCFWAYCWHLLTH